MHRAACLVILMAPFVMSCLDSSASPTPAPSPLPSRATFVDGETFVAVRTLPPAALSAEQLEVAATATAPGGVRIQLAKARAADVKDWEMVSVSPDGWRVWQPQVVLDTVAGAGSGASLVSVERVDWPDSCLGLAHAGEVCAQVVTPGYRVIVNRDSKQLEYHTGLSSENGGPRMVAQP